MIIKSLESNQFSVPRYFLRQYLLLTFKFNIYHQYIHPKLIANTFDVKKYWV